MIEKITEMLATGGHANSLGRVNEVIVLVLDDKSRLDELYNCLFNEDAWVRMRAADALEKICREHPDWLERYIDRFPDELATSGQASIQWHLAQIYSQVNLTDKQREFAIDWLKHLLSTKETDWIVAANAMATLAQFTREGSFGTNEMVALLKIQQQHKSNAVIKRADKLLAEFLAA
jgi:hypothetical protein